MGAPAGAPAPEEEEAGLTKEAQIAELEAKLAELKGDKKRRITSRGRIPRRRVWKLPRMEKFFQRRN